MYVIAEDRDGVIDLRREEKRKKGRGRCRIVMEGMGEEF